MIGIPTQSRILKIPATKILQFERNNWKLNCISYPMKVATYGVRRMYRLSAVITECITKCTLVQLNQWQLAKAYLSLQLLIAMLNCFFFFVYVGRSGFGFPPSDDFIIISLRCFSYCDVGAALLVCLHSVYSEQNRKNSFFKSFCAMKQ